MSDERSEWETSVATRLHYAMCGECPAFPGSKDACEPLMCDCLCPHSDMSFDETIQAACDAIRAADPREAMRQANLADALAVVSRPPKED